MTQIPGYRYGEVAASPVTTAELDDLLATVLFGPEDHKALIMASEVLADQVDDVLDVWYGFVGSHPFLLNSFTSPETGEPIASYLDAVRRRFGQWLLDTCRREYDQTWLAYQNEIALRHTPAKKNRTDDVDSVPVVSLRYVIALIVPLSTTIKPFLAKKGHTPEQVEAMHAAFTKSLVLQVALWSRAYTDEGW